MKRNLRRRLFVASLIVVIAPAIYVGWGPLERLLWAPAGSYVVLVIEGEGHESYLGDNCYGLGCTEFDGFPVRNEPISVPSGILLRIDFPKLEPSGWAATAWRVPEYPRIKRNSSMPHMLQPSGDLTHIGTWDATSNDRVAIDSPGWYILQVDVDWVRGSARYVFWLNGTESPRL